MRGRPALAAIALLAACRRPVAHPGAIPAAGISIALYDAGSAGSYGVVDERRWIDLTGTHLELEQIDPGAALASLVIEPLAGPPLRVGGCMREQLPESSDDQPTSNADREVIEARLRLLTSRVAPTKNPEPKAVTSQDATARFSPVVRCTVHGAPGRHLVRVLYVTTRLRFRAQHDVSMTAVDRATVASRFAIVTPAWHAHADVTLFDGAPGGEHPPREVARGNVLLDGATVVIAAPPRSVRAQLRRIYDGAVLSSDVPSTEAMWGKESVQAVWVWLELEPMQLARGPMRVHLEVAEEGAREIDVPAEGRQQAGAEAPLRLPLWVDESLRGMRQRFVDLGESSSLAERFLLSVANLGETPREVWIEEHVRSAHHRRVVRAWPNKPILAGDRLRNKLTVAPGKIERVGYTVAYDM
ncbi:MAG: hypothetical protein JWO36_3889 [Myxococcales bacterium]|nr:hypothetical protein [Myxococcales bacterium]